jgi:hypothetical protein
MHEEAKVVTVDAGAKTDFAALKRNGVLAVVVRAAARRTPGKSDTKGASTNVQQPASPSPEAETLGAAGAAGLLAALMLPLSDDMKGAIDEAKLPDGSRLFIDVKDGTKPGDVSADVAKLRTIIGVNEPNLLLTVKIGQRTVREYESLFDGVLADWTDCWVHDDSREALASGEPKWPKGTFARWRLWEWGEATLDDVKLPASAYNGLDEELERWFAGQAPPPARDLEQVSLQPSAQG